jgi:response regulator RpfG family c-di-GMP phosphodiesterase
MNNHNQENNGKHESEFLTFFEMETETNTDAKKATENEGKWKIMIVDDDDDVQNITKFILEDFNFEGKEVELISAYSGKEALELLEKNPETAVIFLDVVMENDSAGFYVAKYIRENIQNKSVRIILRTGQPGLSPEKKAMIDYDINDYKLKTELTEDKLLISIISALRSYRDIIKLEVNKGWLEKLVETSANIFKIKSYEEFVKSILQQLISFFNIHNQHQDFEASGLIAVKQDSKFKVIEGVGKYFSESQKLVYEVIGDEILEDINKSLQEEKVIFKNNKFLVCFKSEPDRETLIYFETNKQIDEMDKNLLELMSTNIKIAFDNVYLNKEIETTQKEIIFTLGEVTEARSKETGFHVKRVAEYSALLGRLYGLSEDEVKLIRMAAPMHDIGKLGIPDAILNKPGKLTQEEFEIIKTHAMIGHDMLKSSSRKILQTATIIALQHHEKYDGTGYPIGLKGQQIHIYGRITAIADVFDALAVERVYKKAWETEEILQFFREERGKHFDPNLIDIFFDHLDEFLEIKNNYPDDIHNNVRELDLVR